MDVDVCTVALWLRLGPLREYSHAPYPRLERGLERMGMIPRRFHGHRAGTPPQLVLQMNVGDYFTQGRRGWVTLNTTS